VTRAGAALFAAARLGAVAFGKALGVAFGADFLSAELATAGFFAEASFEAVFFGDDFLGADFFGEASLFGSGFFTIDTFCETRFFAEEVFAVFLLAMNYPFRGPVLASSEAPFVFAPFLRHWIAARRVRTPTFRARAAFIDTEARPLDGTSGVAS
jgi:hypothetical protein